MEDFQTPTALGSQEQRGEGCSLGLCLPYYSPAMPPLPWSTSVDAVLSSFFFFFFLIGIPDPLWELREFILKSEREEAGAG